MLLLETGDKTEGETDRQAGGWTEDLNNTHRCYCWTRYRSELLMIPPATSKTVLNLTMSKPLARYPSIQSSI